MRRFLDTAGVGPAGARTSVRFVVLAATAAVAATFLAAGWPKIADPAGFALAVYRYQVLPDVLINCTALYMPWLEIVAALALLLAPRLRFAAGLLIFGMLILFTTLIGINMYRGIDVACGCFSTDPAVGHFGWLLVARNTVLLVLTGLSLRGASRRGNLRNESGEPRRVLRH